MSRKAIMAAAQMGPVGDDESKASIVNRLVEMLREAASRGARLVVFPELALCQFFPHRLVEGEELDSYFDREMPNPSVMPLFEAAKELEVGFCIGYAELEEGPEGARRFNTNVLVDETGEVVGKYRKVHVPGFEEPTPGYPHQSLERRYFSVGDLGFPVTETLGTRVGMAICNDRRWSETYRVLRLQGAEVMVLGYNTPALNPAQPQMAPLTEFHNHLTMQAGAYQNSMWVIAAARAGIERGVNLIAGSCIIAPTGQIVALSTTTGDEVITASCDLDLGAAYRRFFNFKVRRQPQFYGLISEPTPDDA